MAKKDEIIVDEELIRDMIRGNVPMYQSGEPAQVEKKTESSVDKPATDVEPPKFAPAQAKRMYPEKKRKEVAESYAERFLVNREFKNRVTLNVNRELYDKIRKYLAVIAPQVTLTSYLNNVIADHLDRNWDEINELYSAELKKPLQQ